MNIEILKQRSSIIKLIRRYFDEREYLEMHTPRLVGLPGQEPHLEPLWTDIVESNGLTHASALITSPEYAMKRLLAAGFDKIYDLGPCFRNNEPWDGTHDPEFLMLEWYRKNGDLASLIDETEEMVRWITEEIRNPKSEIRNKTEIQNSKSDFLASDLEFVSDFGFRISDLDAPFRRMTCEEAWKEYANVDLASLIGDREAIATVAREQGQTVAETDTWDDLYFKVFLSKIEPKVASEPTFLYRYPSSQAALARRCKDDDRFADRVELYVGGLELANGFAELADADEQRRRFVEEQALRQSLGKKTWPIDEAFLSDLPKMGEAVGIAFGVDRLVMLLTGASSINDVVPFSARERFSK